MASSLISTSTPSDPSKKSEMSGQSEIGGFPAVLTVRDMTVLVILTVVFIVNTSGVQFAGPAAFLYWTFGIITFLIPSAYVTHWLARRFPGQGGIYLWAVKILGSQWGFITAFCAWLSGTIGVVSAIEGCTAFIQYLEPTWFVHPAELCLAIIVILVIATAIAILPLRIVLRVLLGITVLYVGVCLMQCIAGVTWLLNGHQVAISMSDLTKWQLNVGNVAVYGIVILALVGVHVPLVMGGEIRGNTTEKARANKFIWFGIIISSLAYLIGTFGIMVVVPVSQSGSTAANALAVQIVFGALVGNITALCAFLGFLGITIAYILMFSRLLSCVAKDSHLPLRLTHVNRAHVPVISILTQTGIVATVSLLCYIIVPTFFSQFMKPDDLSLAIYNVLQAVASIIWVVSSIQLFVMPFVFLRRNKTSEHRISRKAFALLLAMSSVGVIASFVAIWDTVASSWIPNLIPNDHWQIIVVAVTLIALAVGWLSSELPRAQSLLSEQRRVNDREIALRAQLEEANVRLQETHKEQEISILQQQELLAELDRLYKEQALAAITDAVTGLPNHRAVMSRMSEEISRCERAETTCAILFIDLDHFKRVNDTWGHRAGDAILRQVASRLRTSLRTEDFVGRYGGEEFAIVLTDVDLLGASETAERLRMYIAEQPCVFQADETSASLSIPVTASMGVAVYGLHGTVREELVERADHAMYRAKQSGRNRVCIADLPQEEIAQPEEQIVIDVAREKEVLPGLVTSTIQALTAAASAHDQGTDDHSHRMVVLAVATARALNQSEDEIHLVRLGALLHDIGKIGIPDAILHKPGPLSEEEWVVMRLHPEIGQNILDQAGGVFSSLAKIVVAHHERWDGKGYPKKLVGEEIPLAARILTVIDSYDAMTSRRVYRNAMSPMAAREELKRCAGSQYDPKVVDAFLHVLDTHDILGSVLIAAA